VNLALETTSDLNAWSEAQRLTGQGTGNTVKVILQPDPNVQAKFWRVRVRQFSGFSCNLETMPFSILQSETRAQLHEFYKSLLPSKL
jgi:hypothetical protein